ncbi:hypothetical protein LMG24235_06679 [Paraburkholderia sabiae]|nr:hypothetical protein LMG24235_06679 [Paraburkholderia sabiae]
MRRRQPKIYATLRRRFCTEALVTMGFKYTSTSGSTLVKLGACRTPYATASRDGEFWRVTPLVGPRIWRAR